MPKFVKGQSGNPKGRTPGSGKIAQLRESIAAAIPEIVASLVEAAKGGDTSAARLLLERTIPPLRPVDLPAPVPMDGDLAEAGRRVLSALASGEITPSQAGDILGALAVQGRIVAQTGLEGRVARFENPDPMTDDEFQAIASR